MGIGLIIKKLREKEGLSQDNFSKKLEITRASLGHIETERYFPTLQVLSKIVRICNTSYEYLIEGIASNSITNYSAFINSEDTSSMLDKIVELAGENALLNKQISEYQEIIIKLKTKKYYTEEKKNIAAEPNLNCDKNN